MEFFGKKKSLKYILWNSGDLFCFVFPPWDSILKFSIKWGYKQTHYKSQYIAQSKDRGGLYRLSFYSPSQAVGHFHTSTRPQQGSSEFQSHVSLSMRGSGLWRQPKCQLEFHGKASTSFNLLVPHTFLPIGGPPRCPTYACVLGPTHNLVHWVSVLWSSVSKMDGNKPTENPSAALLPKSVSKENSLVPT